MGQTGDADELFEIAGNELRAVVGDDPSFGMRIFFQAALKDVDAVIPQRTQDKFAVWERLKFDRWVVGDDWFDSDKYQEYRRQLEEVGVECVFLPYTAGISSTIRRRAIGA